MSFRKRFLELKKLRQELKKESFSSNSYHYLSDIIRSTKNYINNCYFVKTPTKYSDYFNMVYNENALHEFKRNLKIVYTSISEINFPYIILKDGNHIVINKEWMLFYRQFCVLPQIKLSYIKKLKLIKEGGFYYLFLGYCTNNKIYYIASSKNMKSISVSIISANKALHSLEKKILSYS